MIYAISSQALGLGSGLWVQGSAVIVRYLDLVMFTRKTVSFLRSLKRNNDREWFRAHKEDYERHVRGPMIEVLARLAVDMPSFAPELIADPKVSLFRPYRDTRFSSDKSRRTLSLAPVRARRGSRTVFRSRPALGLDRRRDVHAIVGRPQRYSRRNHLVAPAAPSAGHVANVHTCRRRDDR